MTRYVALKRKARADHYSEDLEEYVASPSTITVHEIEDEPEPTGILDRHGNEYHRLEDRTPAGYIALRTKA